LEKKIETSNKSSTNNGLIIGILSLLVIILFIALTIATVKLKDSGFFSDGTQEDEMDEWIGNIETLAKNEESDSG